MERALLTLTALALNAALGGPKRFYAALGLAQPGVRLSAPIRHMEQKLNREHRSAEQREMRGLLLVILCLAAAWIAGILIDWLLSPHLRWLEAIVLAFCLPLRSSWECAWRIRQALRQNHLAAARNVLSASIWRHHAILDAHALARAAIETLAVHGSEKIMAPIFWYLCLGLPGLFLSKTAYFLREALGKKETDDPFAKAACRVHAALHLLPALLHAGLWRLAGWFLPSLRTGPQETARFYDPDPIVLTLRSATSVLRLSLGGPLSVYGGQDWIGTGGAKAMPGDIDRALYLFTVVQLCLFVLLGLLL